MKQSKKKNIIILLTGGNGFPIGDAYTNRLMALAKGFYTNGCNVTILILYPGKYNSVQEKGNFEGIDYIFMCSLKRPVNTIYRKLTGIKGIVRTVAFLCRPRENKIDYVLTFSQGFIQNFPVYLISRIYKFGFFRENNEFPLTTIKRGSIKLSLSEKLFYKTVNSIYDGYIYISSALKTFNISLINKHAQIIIVPIVVDKERFNFKKTERKLEITYCGNLFGEKDGVRILIEAFARIAGKHSSYKLMLIGDISKTAEFNEIQDQINQLGIFDKVVFTGFITGDEVPAYLMQSSLLVLARPDNIQAQGGFPTKLGEYLASGRPVLVTSVSDIPNYISHGINGFLAKPGSIDDFANKMDEILSNYQMAINVGIEGKKLTETYFNNVYQASRILDFMANVKKTKN